jgi:hypothetical protein
MTLRITATVVGALLVAIMPFYSTFSGEIAKDPSQQEAKLTSRNGATDPLDANGMKVQRVRQENTGKRPKG